MIGFTSDKEGIRILVDVLAQKGIRRVVLSPGSRNAPLIIAFARRADMEHFVVADERSAAFFALGMAQQSGEAVALACTSGTALLNYAPAIAEAYYQRLPLVVISADRPEEWIDQDDSQTIRQREVFRNLVKASWQFPAEIGTSDERWYVSRSVNAAVNCALGGRKGPVHLNIPLHEPLYGQCRQEERACCRIERADFSDVPDAEIMKVWAEKFSICPKVMILASGHLPDKRLQTALRTLALLPNVVVLSETVANVGNGPYIGTIDRVLAVIGEEEKESLAPKLLVSYGGPLISRHVKTFLRSCRPRMHWRVARGEEEIDTFQALSTQIDVEPAVFLSYLARYAHPTESDYAVRWEMKRKLARQRHEAFAAGVPWSDWKAFHLILPALPVHAALQLSNSTPVRYAQLFECTRLARVDGNRGTSGIDGSTSTAVGAAWLNPGMTVLITGDMGFLYDSNALWNRYITSRLKIIVMKNGGGGIFRFLPGSSETEELEECFETVTDADVRGFAILHHFAYVCVSDAEQLVAVLPDFFGDCGRPAILSVETPRKRNAEVLRDYFKRLKGEVAGADF